ncbi:MAG: hypothetical protein CEO22_426, partial [Candidatus Berkelbacteria bacterium Gr01-1014_85]
AATAIAKTVLLIGHGQSEPVSRPTLPNSKEEWLSWAKVQSAKLKTQALDFELTRLTLTEPSLKLKTSLANVFWLNDQQGYLAGKLTDLPKLTTSTTETQRIKIEPDAFDF